MNTARVSEVTAALRAAATDPHRLLAHLAEQADPALFDALLSSTTLQQTGTHNTQAPVSGRFRGERSAMLLRGLIALAPPDCARAARLRREWAGILLAGSRTQPQTVSARYLDRLAGLKAVHITDAAGVTALADLAAHPGLSLLSFDRCSLLLSDLSALHGACLERLRWSGQHGAVQESFSLKSLDGLSVAALEIRDVWKLTSVARWPDGLTELSVCSAPGLVLPVLPAGLTSLQLQATPRPDLAELPDTLHTLVLQAMSLPELSGLPALPRLRRLTLSGGHAADLRWLPAGLTHLTLSARLESIAGIEAAAGLVEVVLGGSPDLTDLEPLLRLPDLARVAVDRALRPHLPRALRARPGPTAAPRTRRARQEIPAAHLRATQTIRELFQNNSPAATEQAVELVRALCSPELVEILLDGVAVRAVGQWQEVVGGRRFSGHRQPAALSLIALAGVGQSLALRDGLTALQVSLPILDLADLAALPALTRLSLVGVKELRSPEVLSELERLSVLRLQRCVLPEEVSLPVGVRRLQIDRLVGHTSLALLSACGRLESVHISDAPALCSVRGLDSPVLSEVSLERAEALASTNALADCPSLSRLQISGALSLERLGGLQDHPGLRSLQVRHAVKLAAVPDLPQLTTLTLDAAPIATLPALPSLTTLSLQRCRQLRDLGQPGSRLGSVQLLHCPQLCDLTPLAASRGLTGLHLTDCPLIGDLRPLAGLSALSRLTLRDRILPLDLTPLADCPGLTELDLRGCTGLTGLEALSDLRRLTVLRLGRTGLSRTDLPVSLRRIARWGR